MRVARFEIVVKRVEREVKHSVEPEEPAGLVPHNGFAVSCESPRRESPGRVVVQKLIEQKGGIQNPDKSEVFSEHDRERNVEHVDDDHGVEPDVECPVFSRVREDDGGSLLLEFFQVAHFGHGQALVARAEHHVAHGEVDELGGHLVLLVQPPDGALGVHVQLEAEERVDQVVVVVAHVLRHQHVHVRPHQLLAVLPLQFATRMVGLHDDPFCVSR
mmetsp:Transcript_84849/g.182965  ORF Transcript_84849/g.182965 Transcript_84849/m.182965 type:complete len:216 (-) Transcript_84849:68-715(-)